MRQPVTKLREATRHHQIPFYLLERERPERRAHLISHQTRCDLLAVLASADARGRICPDGARLLDNIALFRELCREEGCLSGPKAFASAHSRILYRTAGRTGGKAKPNVSEVGYA